MDEREESREPAGDEERPCQDPSLSRETLKVSGSRSSSSCSAGLFLGRARKQLLQLQPRVADVLEPLPGPLAETATK